MLDSIVKRSTGNYVKCTARFQAFACESSSFLHSWKVIFDGAMS